MHEIRGDIWAFKADARGITTNGIVRPNGRAVMGAGLALQAARRDPHLPERLGHHLRDRGNHVAVFDDVITIPTKEHYRASSSLELVERSVVELVEAVDRAGFGRVVIPRLGCGLGGLSWESVRPLLVPLDHRFFVIRPQ